MRRYYTEKGVSKASHAAINNAAARSGTGHVMHMALLSCHSSKII